MNREEYKRAAISFLSNIQMKTKDEITKEKDLEKIEKKNNIENNLIKKINLQNIQTQPIKIKEQVHELVSYTKFQVLIDARAYLLNLINNVNQSENEYHRETQDHFEDMIELEEEDGLKLVKLDSIKRSYCFHLGLKSSYNFAPILIDDIEDNYSNISY